MLQGPGQLRPPCFAEMDTSATKNNPQGLNYFQDLSFACWDDKAWESGVGVWEAWVLQELRRLLTMGEAW